VSKLKIAVLVSSSGSNLQSLINAEAAGKINGSIGLVISDRCSAYALQRAENNGIKAVCIDKKAIRDEKEFNRRLMNCLEEYRPDLIILAGYLSILSTQLIDKYKHRIINIHPSLLPAFGGKGFYGERVHRSVIEYGVKVTGATVHFVDENTDTGPIILQKSVEVLETDTVEALAERVLSVEHSLIVEAAALFCDGRLKVEGRRVRIL
jgi:phosphoribosylglycinamide formyltransferase-1